MPLERDESDKPHIWWRVPKDWAPSGVLFAREQTPTLLRALARSPRSRERDALLAHAAKSARAADSMPNQVEPPALSDIEQSWLSAVEDAADRRSTLGMRYFSADRGRTEWRYVSVQRVLVGPPSRFVGLCHRSGTLKWFRVENISLAKLETGTPYRVESEPKVSAFLKESIGAFRGDGDPIACAFVVREPEARWVALNLPSGMAIDPDEPVTDGVRVRCSTPALLRVARFVVGLGAAARAETPGLAACVRELAQGALDATMAAPLVDANANANARGAQAKRLKLRRSGE